MFKFSEGPRGLVALEGMDLYETPVSFQESSLATQEAIWVGVDRTLCPWFVFGTGAACRRGECPAGEFHDRLGDVSIPAGGRMHLSREQARELGRMLTHWADEGDEFWEAEQKRREVSGG